MTTQKQRGGSEPPEPPDDLKNSLAKLVAQIANDHGLEVILQALQTYYEGRASTENNEYWGDFFREQVLIVLEWRNQIMFPNSKKEH